MGVEERLFVTWLAGICIGWCLGFNASTITHMRKK